MEFNKHFKMFMTTKLANPSFSPELSAKMTIINFTVTQGGLEQQLLGRVLSKEQKALEDQLTQLLTDITLNKKGLQKLDALLLEKLTTAEGSLLENTELVEVLNTTKTESKSVAAKLDEAEVTTIEINEKRASYKPVAIRGAIIYFTIIEMSLVNWMYNSSLGQFLDLFDHSIAHAVKSQQTGQRVENIITELTYYVYRYVNRGLFEIDKVTFKLMLAFNMMLKEGKINGGDIGFFLKGGGATEKPNPYKFMEAEAWANLQALSKHSFKGEGNSGFFKELPDWVQKDEIEWQNWFKSSDPEKSIPSIGEWGQDTQVKSFLQLVLIRSLRMDRTQVKANDLISETLGPDFIKPITDSMESIWMESKPSIPVLFLLSAGADPTQNIDEFAKKKKKFPCDKVSMGEGQEKYAREKIQNGLQNGTWTILQNCHLGLGFMERLDYFYSGNYDEFGPPGATFEDAHPDFRLFITCEPHNKFPLGLLQKSIKVTNEPPKGIKAGLFKTYTTIINQDFLEKIEHHNWRNLTFTVCFLHSIVKERRKFGPLGWCVPYEFNNSDLEASLAFCEKNLNLISNGQLFNSPNLPINWEVIQYMVCEIQYGGRITDDLDRELFKEYGKEYFGERILSAEGHTFYPPPKESKNQNQNQFKYKIPIGTEITKFLEYIDLVPNVDSPEVFGLHPNADLTFRRKESKEMMDTILETRPKDSGGGGGKSRSDIVKDQAREYLQRLPPDYVDLEVRRIVRELGGPRGSTEKGMTVPLNIFLYQEICRM
jgi:dynein heavy chain